MKRRQAHKTPRRNCDRCKTSTQNCEKVSKRILAPAGGYLCPDCITAAAHESGVSHGA